MFLIAPFLYALLSVCNNNSNKLDSECKLQLQVGGKMEIISTPHIRQRCKITDKDLKFLFPQSPTEIFNRTDDHSVLTTLTFWCVTQSEVGLDVHSPPSFCLLL